MKLLVLADDFTGALDTGVQFAKAGMEPWVALEPGAELDGVPSDNGVLVIDTESRHLPPGEAARRLGEAARAAMAKGYAHVYKKTDSTLRGNIGAEIKAAMDALGGGPAAFAPAYPKAGRTTVGGRQHVNGVPLEATSFARDPLDPIKTGGIAELLRRQADVRVTVVGRGETPRPFEGRDTVYVFDGETDEDLAWTAGLLKEAGFPRVTAGCAGFAEHLAELWDARRGAPEIPTMPRNILLVCGSLNERSALQLERAGELGYWTFAPEARALSDPSYWDTEEGRGAVRRAAEELDRRGRLLVRSASPGGERLPASACHAAARSLGLLAGGILGRAAPCVLAVFGGDTAMGVARAAGCGGLKPVCEIEPGVALSVMQSRLGETCLISKAGGLGSVDALRTIDEFVGRSRA
jgi:uncharacterized protein YgbK (DUF1537 family)